MKYSAMRRPVLLLALFLLVALTVFVAATAAQEFPAEPDTGFEIEGNTALDGDGKYDWETVDRPPAVLLPDPHSKTATDRTTFKPDGKFEEPETWSILPGVVGPGQNELTNVLAWAIPPGELDGRNPEDFWLIMGMERTKKEGTFFLDFEYNQLEWDDLSRGPRRSAGDIVVGFELKGNPIDRVADLSVLIVQYLPGAQPSLCEVTPGNGGKPAQVKVGSDPCPAYGDGGWYYRFLADGGILADSGLGQATMNDEPFEAPWPSYDAQGKSRSTIGIFEFAEAAINLTKLGIEPKCETFSSVHAKSRSSLEVTADLKDVTAVVPLSVNCRLDGHKFLDVDGDGEWDKAAEPPLPGWQINLSDGSTTVTDRDGFYEFEYLADGEYTITEQCPDEWVQTAPGMTGFEDCGSETHSADINIRNREVTDLDFGNGKPAIDAEKRCTSDVFVGDDVEVEITVTNNGNVDLHDVKVVDELVGLDEMIDLMEPGDTLNYKRSYVATEAMVRGGDPGALDKHTLFLPMVMVGRLQASLIARDPITNTVSVEGQYAAVTVSDSDQCVTEVHELEVSKDAQTSFTSKFSWDITKAVDKEGPILLYPGQPASLTYTITVELEDQPSVIGNWTVSGTITIDNPAPIEAELDRVVDEISGGFTPTVVCPSLTVPANDSLICTYGPTPLPDGSERLNTATVVLVNNNGGETPFTATAPVKFSDPTDIIDEAVEVRDDAAITVENPTGRIGVVTYDEAPKSFVYQRRIVGPIGDDQCVEAPVEVVNTASIITNDTKLEEFARATTAYLCIQTLTVTSEDLPLDAGNDWDYNDIVVKVNPVLTYSDDGDLQRVSFLVNQVARYSTYRHSVYFRPTAFACDGTYSRWVGDSLVDEDEPFDSAGTNITIIEDTNWAPTGQPEPIRVVIDFDVPSPGACPLDLSQPQFELVGRYHGQGLFFAPWVYVKKTDEAIESWADPPDPRLLNVPTDWVWPVGQHIWEAYPKVQEPLIWNEGPQFTPLWWLPD